MYEEIPGWRCDISGVREFGSLPKEARQYLRRIEELVEVPIGWVSVGPGREAMIRRT